MNKKSVNLILVVGILLVLSFSVISASWFSDFFAKLTGTGSATTTEKNYTTIQTPNVTLPWGNPKVCGDSVSINQFCLQKGYDGGELGDSYSGGACVKWDGSTWYGGEGSGVSDTLRHAKCYDLVEVPECTDSDGGKNYYVKGNTTDAGATNPFTDACQDNKILTEHWCGEDGRLKGGPYTCPNGCLEGACVGSVYEQYTLEEGQSMNINVAGNIIKLMSIEIWPERAEFAVTILGISGKDEVQLSEGESLVLPHGGAVITVHDIAYSSNAEIVSKVTFSLSSASTCTDSDGGKNYYVKGYAIDENGDRYNDSCWSGGSPVNSGPVEEGDYLYERFCPDPGLARFEAVKRCSNGCVDGACIEVNYTGTCSELVNEVANPSDFKEGGVSYSLDWSGSYNNSWWGTFGNETPKNYTEYYASWWFNYENGDDWKENKYGYMQESAMVFEDKFFEAINVMKDYVKSGMCQVRSYTNYANKSVGEESLFYVCTWNVYDKGLNIDQSDWQHREIFWAHNNVLVRMSIGMGKYLSEQELSLIIEKEITKFLASLQNNEPNYLGWERFDIDWPLENHLFDVLATCPSDIPDDTCRPYWECITEPTICPEHGYQTQTCKDYSCESPDIVSQISCNPGICSGCLVPKWFDDDSLGNNRCIPYGFRFENQIGWIEGIETDTGFEILTVKQANDYGNEVNLSISSDGLVTLEVEGWGDAYTFREGDNVQVNITGWDGKFVSLSFVATKVVYDSENYENSYIWIDFTYTYLGRTEETVNAYCDIDGNIKPQKTKTADGSWASCQNNYECDSNLCSSGECIELGDIAREASAFKTVVVKFFCRIVNLLSNEGYDQCLIDNGIEVSN